MLYTTQFQRTPYLKTILLGFSAVTCLRLRQKSYFGTINTLDETVTVCKRCCKTLDFVISLLFQYRRVWLPFYRHHFPVLSADLFFLHDTCAQHTLDFCKEQGGLFIKIGQYAASLQNILPREYTTVLSSLQDKTEETPFEQIDAVLRTELGSFYCLLTNISKNPIGSASIAQVHRANLIMSPTEIALKVQKPNIQQQVTYDLRILSAILFCYTYFTDSAFRLWSIFNDFIEEVSDEMNFQKENENNRKLADCFQSNSRIGVPKIYKHLCSTKVLTMEYIDGIKLSDCFSLQTNVRYRIAQTLHEAFATMLFDKGFIHMDMHPGNIIVQHTRDENEVRLVLLDTGKCRPLDEEFLQVFAQWMVAITEQNFKTLKKFFHVKQNELFIELLAALFVGTKTIQGWEGNSNNNSTSHTKTKNLRHSYRVEDYLDFINAAHPEWLNILRSFLIVRGVSRKLGYRKNVSYLYAPHALRHLLLLKRKTHGLASFSIREKDTAWPHLYMLDSSISRTTL